MTLDDAKIQRFLATKEVAVLATEQPDGPPHPMASTTTMIAAPSTQASTVARAMPTTPWPPQGGGP